MRIYLQLNANRIELAAFPETKCKELKVRIINRYDVKLQSTKPTLVSV